MNGNYWEKGPNHAITFNGKKRFNAENNGLLHFKGTNSFKLDLTPKG